jgi:hypothetical protein
VEGLELRDGTFRQNLWRMVRRDEAMVPVSLAPTVLVDELRIRLVPAALAGGVLAVGLSPDQAVLGAAVFLCQPYCLAHLMGVRYRWWAAGAAVAVGGVVGLAVRWVLVGVGLEPPWTDVLAVIAATGVAAPAYTAVTRIGAGRLNVSP